MPSGITTNGAIGFDGAQAMSTFLHETIHWWQHIGSTYGFIYGLNYPVQSHAAYLHLRRILDGDGFKKSVLQQAELLNKAGPTGFGTLAGTANIIVNNHFDLGAFRAFTQGPESTKSLTESPLFEGIGHALHMTYGQTVGILASTVDHEFSAIPHPEKWAEGFRELKTRKVEGYYYGSPISLWPIGSHELFEGQARFSQIQFLSHACGHQLDWQAYKDIGMLDGIYVSAFKEFLRLVESKWPERTDDPLIGLFLLVCDLAINPGSGFPFPVTPNFETFINDVNPGARFAMFSRLIATRHPAMKTAIRDHSREEYEALSTELSLASKEYPPLLVAKVFSDWFASSGPLSGLRKEYETYDFSPRSFVIRHLFAHFLAFQEDKYKTPEVFCWPGACFAGDNLSKRYCELFEKHGALFVDKEDDDSIFPRLQHGRAEATVHSTFSKFYNNTVIYDLVGQWIGQEGQFRYDVGWLAANAKNVEMETYLRRQFSSAFGVDPADAYILR